MAYKGIEYMRNKLMTKRTGALKRYKYYEMKNLASDFGISTPEKLRNWTSSLGWCSKAVDTLADRLSFKEFRNDNFGLNEIFNMNNPDIFFDSAILEALIESVSFVYISKDERGFPRLQVITGADATGCIDPITGLLKEGYAVLERDEFLQPKKEAYFISGETQIISQGVQHPEIYRTNVLCPLLVPIINRPDAKRPFGHSRISRACMDLMDSAIRTIKRSEISAEFYSFPQKYIIGLSSDKEIDKWKAAMSYVIQIEKDEDGDRPIMGQFSQQSMAPHTEHLKMFAGAFAGETGLTLEDLGFSSGNPASAEAIKASHDNLRLTARKAQRNFGSGLLNVGYLAACLRDDITYKRSEIFKTYPVWEPLFEPDSAMLSSIGDGAIKINQALPGYFNKDNLSLLTGIESSSGGELIDRYSARIDGENPKTV